MSKARCLARQVELVDTSCRGYPAGQYSFLEKGLRPRCEFLRLSVSRFCFYWTLRSRQRPIHVIENEMTRRVAVMSTAITHQFSGERFSTPNPTVSARLQYFYHVPSSSQASDPPARSDLWCCVLFAPPVLIHIAPMSNLDDLHNYFCVVDFGYRTR